MPYNKPISEEEQEQYKHISQQKKIDVMEMYLIGRNGRSYNMEEVGEVAFNDKNASFTVSMIHRANGIHCGKGGSKAGLYRQGCKFEKTYGYRVSRRDIEDFIKEYEPWGSALHNVSFEDWLIARAKKVSQGNRKPEQTNLQMPSPQVPSRQKSETASHGLDLSDKVPGLIGILAVIALVYIFRKKIWFYILSLLPFVIVIGVVVLIFKYVLFPKEKPPKPENNAHQSRKKDTAKENSVREKEPKDRDTTIACIFWGGLCLLIGVSALMNTDQPIMGLIFLGIGVILLRKI